MTSRLLVAAVALVIAALWPSRVSAQSVTPSTVDLTVYVVQYYFQGQATPTDDPLTQARASWFKSGEVMSYGALRVTPVPIPWTQLDIPSTCSLSTLLAAARRSYASFGYVSGPRNLIAMHFRPSGCSPTIIGSAFSTTEFYFFDWAVAMHEFLHRLGLPLHAHALSCVGTTCTSSDAADPWSSLGWSPAGANASAPERARLGWLTEAGGLWTRLALGQGGTFTVETTEPMPMGRMKLLTLPLGANPRGYQELAISAQRLERNNTVYPAQLVVRGVSGTAFTVLDLDPAAGDPVYVLSLGRSWTYGGITITTIGVTPSTVTFTVSGTPVNTCVSDPLVVTKPSAVGHVLSFPPFTATDERGCQATVTP